MLYLFDLLIIGINSDLYYSLSKTEALGPEEGMCNVELCFFLLNGFKTKQSQFCSDGLLLMDAKLMSSFLLTRLYEYLLGLSPNIALRYASVV